MCWLWPHTLMAAGEVSFCRCGSVLRLSHPHFVNLLRRRHGHVQRFHLLRLHRRQTAVRQHAVSYCILLCPPVPVCPSISICLSLMSPSNNMVFLCFEEVFFVSFFNCLIHIVVFKPVNLFLRLMFMPILFEWSNCCGNLPAALLLLVYFYECFFQTLFIFCRFFISAFSFVL